MKFGTIYLVPKQKITFALFDVRPVDPDTKRVNFDWINSLEPIVCLNNLNAVEITFQKPRTALEELESTLSEKIDFNKEIESIGGRLVNSPRSLRPKISPFLILKKDEFDFNSVNEDSENLQRFRKEFSNIFSDYQAAGPNQNIVHEIKLISPPPYLPWSPEINLSENKNKSSVLDLSPAARELELTLDNFKAATSDYYQPRTILATAAVPAFERAVSMPPILPIIEEKTSKSLLFFTFGLVATFILTFLSVKTSILKDNILQRSNQAYINLNSVQDNLSEFKFFEAVSSFALAASNFELMHEDLKKASAVFDFLDKVTLGGVSDTSNLIKAGELISEAGIYLADALGKISGVNLISIIQKDNETNILEVLRQFRLSIIQASRNLNQASSLIADSDSSLIPESEKKKFDELKLRLPEFNGFIEKAINYSDALMTMLGQSSSQRYLLLFQNTSELRPTGGFPGSYALIEFDKGVMKEFFVDDIYNPDGQMKEKIVPPKPLQKITPNWGMRDANWFVDFQASAKKVAEFYYKDTKILVDGVAAVNVDLVPEILKITGPIEMIDFGITLNSDNFIAEVQKEVEYQRTKGDNKPKQILVEFAPKFLERLSQLNKEEWMEVFNTLVSGIENKDILAYFTDSNLQDFALLNGFAGEIKDLPSADYLMISHTNIMGSKTDAVIDNSIFLNIDNSEDGLIHTLEISRFHQGGEFGFYNKKNNDYVRVLLPDDAELIEVSGNDSFEINALLDYRQNGFIFDPDLERYELKIQKWGLPGAEIEILNEGGKKVIAFWMIIEPGQTKTVKMKYKTSAQKRIYVQKQPGLRSNFKLIFNSETLFDESFYSDKNIVLE